jgi:hypothetical protein
MARHVGAVPANRAESPQTFLATRIRPQRRERRFAPARRLTFARRLSTVAIRLSRFSPLPPP